MFNCFPTSKPGGAKQTLLVDVKLPPVGFSGFCLQTAGAFRGVDWCLLSKRKDLGEWGVGKMISNMYFFPLILGVFLLVSVFCFPFSSGSSPVEWTQGTDPEVVFIRLSSGRLWFTGSFTVSLKKNMVLCFGSFSHSRFTLRRS